MKIGILTYHRSHNYGALMQAIALRRVLSDMGHQATFIDYWPAYHWHMYQVFSLPRMMSRKGVDGKWKYLKSCIKYWRYRKERKASFDQFIAEYIEPYTSSEHDVYDMIVHGSDQIWRKQPEIHTYNPVYFGKHTFQAAKKISYAASMGKLSEKEADRQKIKRLLSNLSDISVRERDLLDLVHSLGYTAAHQDIDPTLLLTAEDWVRMFNLKRNDSGERYALYYRILDSFDVVKISRFAESKGLKLKTIYHDAAGQNTESQITTADPRRFLELMYNADFVFTSSFHGLAFSLLFHKPFLASFTKNSGRAASLLADLDLSDRLISPKVALPAQLNEIDYTPIDSKLSLMREASYNSLEAEVCKL